MPGDGQGPGAGRHTVAPWLALLAVALISVNLRPGASAIGPVLEEVQRGLGLGGASSGLLTALPGLCFGAVGAVAVALARRVGVTTGIWLGLLAVVAGLLLRVLTGSGWVFLTLTGLALAGMAVGNVLVPAWIKRHSLGSAVGLMTVYSVGLTLGGALSALLAAPVSAAAPGGWRTALGLWGVVAVLSLVVWLLVGYVERRAPGGVAPLVRSRGAPMSSSPTAVALAALFGIQAMNAYVQFGWLPQVYRDAGLSATYAGALQALLSLITVVGSLAMPTVIARSRTLAPYMVVFGVLLAVGYLGLLALPTTVPWLWAVVLGVAGFAFPTVIALITARTRRPSVTARLSGFVQPVGYALAALGPFLVGLLHDATGGWDAVLWLLAATAVPFVWAGLRVSGPVLVDDELG